MSRRHRLAGGCRLDRRVGAHVFHGCIIVPSGELAKRCLCVSSAPQRCAKHKQPSLTAMLRERGVGCSGSPCSYYPSSHCAAAGGKNMLAAMGNAAQCSTSLAPQPTVRWPPKDGQPALTVRGQRNFAFDRAPLLKCRAQPSRRMLMRIGPQPSHASRWYLCAPTFEFSRPRRAQPGVGRLERRVMRSPPTKAQRLWTATIT